MDDGYGIFPSVISASECDGILSACAFDSKSPGDRRLIENENIRMIANDVRLTTIATKFLSGKAVPYKAVFFNKTEYSNWLVPWHQDRVLPLNERFDSSEWGPWSIKDGIKFAHAPAWALNRVIAVRLHLDASTMTNGPLKLIPGTHKLGVLEQRNVVEIAKRSSMQICLVSKGGVVAMRPLTIHASSKSRDLLPRRVLHIEYANSLRLSDGIELSYS